ncbi:hypothetical protein BX600DRAFT_495389 [Xylariales sp. PMI_506]|nr:hypothetical protein BX600DRAFT_495389 [Xylariales sp. PMI_506]
MPPHSFAEWVIGSNIPRNRRRTSTKHLVSLDWTTDEETGDNTVHLTVPRKQPGLAKQVRFDGSNNKASCRKHYSPVPTEQPVARQVNDKEKSSSECSCDDCISGKQDANIDEEAPLKEVDASKGPVEEVLQDEVDSDCPCGKCIVRRLRMKKEQKQRRKHHKRSPSQSDREIHMKHTASKQKKHVKRDFNTDSENDETLTTSDSETATELHNNPRDTGNKQRRKKSDRRQKTHKKETRHARAKSVKGDSTDNKTPKKKEKSSKTCHQEASKIRQPELLMPVQAQVLQVEHAVETHNDPRPNAFFDVEHGIMRVYHGPSYGNPYGALYPKRMHNGQPPPIGTPHPSLNAWYNGFYPNAQAMQQPMINSHQPGNPWFRGWGATIVPGDNQKLDSSNPNAVSQGATPHNPLESSPSVRVAQNKHARGNIIQSNVGPMTPKAGKSPVKSAARKNDNGTVNFGVQGAGDIAKTNGNGNNFDEDYTALDSQKLQESLERLSKSGASRDGNREGSQKNNAFAMSGWNNNENNNYGGWNNDKTNAVDGNDTWGINENEKQNDSTGRDNNKNPAEQFWGGNQPGTVSPGWNDILNIDNRSRHSKNSARLPGAWPVSGGNVAGAGSPMYGGSGRSPHNSRSPNVPSTAGNVATHADDWGDHAANVDHAGRSNWHDPTAANTTNGFWEGEGKGTEKEVQYSGEPKSGW